MQDETNLNLLIGCLVFPWVLLLARMIYVFIVQGKSDSQFKKDMLNKIRENEAGYGDD